LVAADANAVAFRWKDYRIDRPERWKTMTLSPHEFIRRFLMHVLPKGFQSCRQCCRRGDNVAIAIYINRPALATRNSVDAARSPR
jgi:hypothetical protein